MNDVKHIVVIRNDVLGDAILSAPLLTNIKALFPNATVTLIAQAYVSPIMSAHKALDHIELDFKRNINKPTVLNFIDAIRFFKKKKVDMIVFPVMDPFYVWAAAIAGIKVRVGDKNQLLLSPLLTKKVNIVWRDITKHEIDQQLRLLTPFSSEPLQQDFGIQLNAADSEEAKKKFSDYESKPWVVIHPSYGKGNRGWHVGSYVSLIEALHEKNEYHIFLTGSGSDRDITDVINKNTEGKLINLCNKTTLVELAYLIQKASCVIGAETGPLHLASCFKRPVISISPTKFIQSFRWGPWQTNHVILKKNQKCPLICHTYKRECNHSYCLDTIRPSDVLQAFEFIVSADKFPSSPIHYRFISNATIAIHCDSLDPAKIESILQAATQFKKAGVQVFMTTFNKRLAKQLTHHDIDVLYKSQWHIWFWVKWIAIKNVTLWHIDSHKAPVFYFKLIKHLVALQINLPPLLVIEPLSMKGIKESIDHYLKRFEALSQ